ncbi:MAG: methylated-DNA--[protein]-cysteine S-methyltransferase [Candidatus Omnitrophica bacterium]|jgi:methylated-DNA-[protein]-cysteine S-methyltransferase|nr:methylated-DNA--[protein]-cysteine S-methyltransferase [Candidatus Omnitrophota bacterium]
MAQNKNLLNTTETQWRMASAIGTLYLTASSKGLSGVCWRRQKAPMSPSLDGSKPETRVLRKAAIEITQYLEGKRRAFSIRLDPQGTDFQKSVWDRLKGIPYGETRSYKDVAVSLGNSGAGRAVGTANSQNPLCIVVPCHRVIASDGTLSGYSGPAGVKSKLLALERSRSK